MSRRAAHIFGFGLWVLGFRDWDLGLGVEGLGFAVLGHPKGGTTPIGSRISCDTFSVYELRDPIGVLLLG